MSFDRLLGKISDLLRANVRAAAIVLIFALAFYLTIPVLSRTPPHPDEHQFYLNAFRIMAGKELHNYLHVAVTEYALAGFFTILNIFTTSGVNFPQGDPTAVTFYYGKILGFILYVLTAIVCCQILQRNDKKLKARTIIFAFLFFGSISMYERFIRINSDSFSIFIFLNFVMISLWQHKQRASAIEMFFLNTLFIFLGTFTNLKSLYLMLPLFLINTVAPFIWYEDTKAYRGDRLPKLYRLVLYTIGLAAVTLLLWAALIPRPFNYISFWYGLKKTIVHGTQFDFDYPSQSHNSPVVYIYDLLAYQLGLNYLIPISILFGIAYIVKKEQFIRKLKSSFLSQFDLSLLKSGNLYAATELILLFSFISYYVGVSLRTVHWSRWGAPLGILAIVILSTAIENLVEDIFDDNRHEAKAALVFLPYLLVFAWLPRIALTADLYKTGYSVKDDFYQTTKDIESFAKEKGIPADDVKNKIAWFTGAAGNIKSVSFEEVSDEENEDLEYLLWPYWNIGVVYTKKSVDKETHIQRAFIDKYVENVEYRFPSLLSRYMHFTKKFAWSVLGITWNPEIDSLVESQYAAVKLKKPHDELELNYSLNFSEMNHYASPYSRVFNLANLKDSYMFAPCYTYEATKAIKDGKWVEPPPEIGIFARTAGLYCQSARFRILPKGIYFIRIYGLPEDKNGVQKVYYNLGNFNWDVNTKTAGFVLAQTSIPGEFGVATKEKRVPSLNFEITYILNKDVKEAIRKAVESSP